MLLDAGADIAHRTAAGWSPLHTAASLGNSMQAIELLLAAGAGVWASTADSGGIFPVENAFTVGSLRPELAQRLLNVMLDTDHLAPDPDWKQQVLRCTIVWNKGISGCIQALVDSGTDVFAPDWRGEQR
ncbi:hypothetical protein BDW62DRAFT_172482 [Aspergillus aurantiobrunneus]